MSRGGVAFWAWTKRERNSRATPKEFLNRLVMVAKIKHSLFYLLAVAGIFDFIKNRIWYCFAT